MINIIDKPEVANPFTTTWDRIGIGPLPATANGDRKGQL